MRSIVVEEQSTVFTMSFAKERGKWPRPAPKAESIAAPPVQDKSEDVAPAPRTPTPAKPDTELLVAEGTIKEALAQLWEKVRARKIKNVHVLRIRLFDAGDAFKLLGVVGSIQGAQKLVTLNGQYETTDGGTMEIHFTGSSVDAQPVKEFLEPQRREARKYGHLRDVS